MRDRMAKLHDRWLAYSLQETFFLSRLRLCWYLRAFYERGVKYTEQIPSPLNVWIARNKTKTISLHSRSESDVSKIHLAYMRCLWGAFKYSAFKGVDISKHCVKLPTTSRMTNFDWFSPPHWYLPTVTKPANPIGFLTPFIKGNRLNNLGFGPSVVIRQMQK